MNVAAPGTIAGLLRLTSVAALPAASPGNGNALGRNKSGTADGGSTAPTVPTAPASPSTSGAGSAAAPAAASASTFDTSSDRAVARARADTARFAGAVNDIKALRAELTAARAATLAAQEGADTSGAAAARHAIERTGGRLAAALGTKLGGSAFGGAIDADAEASENLLNVLGTSLSRGAAAGPDYVGTAGSGETAPDAPVPPSPAPTAESPIAAPDDLVPAAAPAAAPDGTTSPAPGDAAPTDPSGGNTTPTDPTGGNTPPAQSGNDTPPVHGHHGAPPAHGHDAKPARGGHDEPHAPGKILRSLLERTGDLAKHGGAEGLTLGGTVVAAARQAAGAYRKAAALAPRR